MPIAQEEKTTHKFDVKNKIECRGLTRRRSAQVKPTNRERGELRNELSDHDKRCREVEVAVACLTCCAKLHQTWRVNTRHRISITWRLGISGQPRFLTRASTEWSALLWSKFEQGKTPLNSPRPTRKVSQNHFVGE